jgi:hypothetical protein
MELVKADGGRRKVLVRPDALSQLRDAGERLEYVAARYARLVGDVADASVPVTDFGGRLDLINGQLGFVVQRLQELMILEHEAARADLLEAAETTSARRHSFPRRMARATA